VPGSGTLPAMTPVALTVAGSDPTSGAGLQADLRAFVAHGVWGCAVPAVITVQSTRGVVRAIPVEASLVGEQLDVLAADVRVSAWKTGALGTRENVEAVAARALTLAAPLVVDPVLVASSGATLLDEGARGALVASLIPRAALVTPNAPEAALLTGRRVETVDEARDAARALVDLGARAVLLKGGHLRGERTDVAVDVLVMGGGMSNVGELYDELPGALASYVFSPVFHTPVVRAAHGDSSGVRGAARLWSDDG